MVSNCFRKQSDLFAPMRPNGASSAFTNDDDDLFPQQNEKKRDENRITMPRAVMDFLDSDSEEKDNPFAFGKNAKALKEEEVKDSLENIQETNSVWSNEESKKETNVFGVSSNDSEIFSNKNEHSSIGTNENRTEKSLTQEIEEQMVEEDIVFKKEVLDELDKEMDSSKEGSLENRRHEDSTYTVNTTKTVEVDTETLGRLKSEIEEAMFIKLEKVYSKNMAKIVKKEIQREKEGILAEYKKQKKQAEKKVREEYRKNVENIIRREKTEGDVCRSLVEMLLTDVNYDEIMKGKTNTVSKHNSKPLYKEPEEVKETKVPQKEETETQRKPFLSPPPRNMNTLLNNKLNKSINPPTNKIGIRTPPMAARSTPILQNTVIRDASRIRSQEDLSDAFELKADVKEEVKKPEKPVVSKKDVDDDEQFNIYGRDHEDSSVIGSLFNLFRRKPDESTAPKIFKKKPMEMPTGERRIDTSKYVGKKQVNIRIPTVSEIKKKRDESKTE
ncbi:hypothetical protein ECANGB1_1662 [Enterospora canceri]|uniref:Uncharacterized protein n=1 Tax=Enterospora canceri TaxID=1081671 RepID=A0A1Y1S965_9MICR|nr:hypothetical protein ECANGB1_1662 [Enterospora canceri]